MTTIKQYAEATNAPHRTKTEEEVVRRAVDVLVDELFTGVDVAVFVEADRELLARVLDEKFFPHGHNRNKPRPKPRA